jgi:hypothetical protein
MGTANGRIVSFVSDGPGNLERGLRKEWFGIPPECAEKPDSSGLLGRLIQYLRTIMRRGPRLTAQQRNQIAPQMKAWHANDCLY